MSISTKTGDGGQSQWQNKRLIKSSLNFEFIGDLDELGSALGLVKSLIKNNDEEKMFLSQIQKDLMLISSLQAYTHLVDADQIKDSLKHHLAELEEKEEKLEKLLPQQKHFLLAGGSQLGAVCHLTRAISRRCERRGVEYFQANSKAPGKKLILAYLNRLSDYLHLLARWFNFQSQTKEEYWA